MLENTEVFWKEFFQMYKDMPALWRVKSKEYGDRNLKAECYMKLVSKLKEIHPDANKEMVVRKIHMYRANFRKELRKLQQYTKFGKTYKPTLWYFDCLRFLYDQQEGLGENCTNEIEHSEEKKQESREVLIQPQMPVSHLIIPKSSGDLKESEEVCLATNPSKIRKPEHYHKKPTKKPPNAEQQEAKDDAEILAKSWAVQYKLMKDDQKLIARKLISDIFFYGCLGSLEMSHAIDLQKMFTKESSSHRSQHFNELPQSNIESNSSFSFAEQEVSNYDSIRDWPMEFNSCSPPLSPATGSPAEVQVNDIKIEKTELS